MNLWGFLPEMFAPMKDSCADFLRSIEQGNIKAEYALPTMIDRMIGKQKLTVSVLSTDAVWFGVTYQEDRASVAEELRALHEKQEDPEKLFG